MKNQIFLFAAILISWITLGTLMFEDKCCSKLVKNPTTTLRKRNYFHGIHLRDGKDFSVKLNDNFIFYKSTSGYLLPLSDSLGNTIDKMVNYLKKNPDKKLKLICRYNPSENLKNEVNWGELRAKEIEKLFISKGLNSKQLIPIGLKDTLLPIQNNRIFGGFIPLIYNP